jgi:hypothetical protein
MCLSCSTVASWMTSLCLTCQTFSIWPFPVVSIKYLIHFLTSSTSEEVVQSSWLIWEQQQQQQQPWHQGSVARLIALLFWHWSLLCCYFMPQYHHHHLLSQPELQHTDVATCVVGAKEPDPTHTTDHTSHISLSCFTFNLSTSTLCPTIVLMPFNYSITCTDGHATSPNCTLIHQLTSSLDVLDLIIEGCWM